MRVRIALLYLLIGSATVPVCAQVTTQTIQPFKSLCISDQETGFNWINGKWIITKFTPDKYILEKLDYEKSMKSANFIDMPLSCSIPNATNLKNETSIVKACYSIRKFGTAPGNAVHAADCYESFKNETLQAIQCPSQGNFKPNGLFVKLPSYISMDLSIKDEKDSIALGVGTCGVL